MNKPDKDQLHELADKWMKGTLTPQEKERLDQWYDTDASVPLMWSSDDSEAQLFERLSKTFKKRALGRQPSIRSLWPRWIAAAIVLIALATGVYYYTNVSEEKQPSQQFVDVLPGGNSASLTLEDGRVVPLDKNKPGITIDDAGFTYSDGTPLAGIGSESAQSAEAFPIQSVILSTPLAGQYQVTLPDGSKVWLNAGSSLTYPIGFYDSERRVELAGEAYFEIAKDSGKPFYIVSNGQEVQVLGTRFNIEAYPEESGIKTTLVDGSVKISLAQPDALPSDHSIVLKPGQQSTVRKGSITVDEVDPESAIAWKNGLFVFNDNLRHTLAQISRWYDVKIEYQDVVDENLTLIGKVSRNMKLSSLLHYMEEAAGNNIKFTLAERRVIVRK